MLLKTTLYQFPYNIEKNEQMKNNNYDLHIGIRKRVDNYYTYVNQINI